MAVPVQVQELRRALACLRCSPLLALPDLRQEQMMRACVHFLAPLPLRHLLRHPLVSQELQLTAQERAA